MYKCTLYLSICILIDMYATFQFLVIINRASVNMVEKGSL